ncbi:YdcF family protein [Sporolactobacillus laevolacticus]|uniref:YdcF family protein n=1 Tax=Sporolactobacillus laevolacticus TaxID=33018 RepID=UPI0025B4C43D|nr:YdcF family protein [Sporolactobacillus laevolacticus]MDN3955181.1 YdcF family protein [Sporolactobacillus laevolacticus]
MLIVYILLAIFLYLVFLIVVTRCYFKKKPYNDGQKKDVLIVLGYPTKKDGSVSVILRERVNRAVQLYHEGISNTIICSGAAAHNDFIEADVMAQALIDQGVPNNCIIRERHSKSTYQNIVNSKKIMQRMKLNSAVIVSSPWHLRKASSYAIKLGINHTVEKSKFPREYLIIGIGMIYIFEYTRMLITHWRYSQVK